MGGVCPPGLPAGGEPAEERLAQPLSAVLTLAGLA
jgi:hypothetical protein